MKKRLQNRVAESHYALVSMAAYALAVWFAGGLVAERLYVQVVLFAVSTYLMMMLNNSNALIRIYSRMVSCSFMALSAMILFALKPLSTSLITLCYITFLLCLFNIYQDKQASGWSFYAFVCLGIATLIMPQLVFFVPFVWMMMGFLLMALSARTFWASVLGLLTPYWFALPFCLLTGRMEFFVNLFHQLIDFQPLFQYDQLSDHRVLSFAVLVVIALTGTVHFLRNSFRDKIRTRMFYNIFIYLTLLTTLFAVLQPQHSDALMCMMVVTVSPLIAHFVALTSTRLTNIAFYVLMAAVLLLTAYNLWMPSLLF